MMFKDLRAQTEVAEQISQINESYYSSDFDAFSIIDDDGAAATDQLQQMDDEEEKKATETDLQSASLRSEDYSYIEEHKVGGLV